MDNASKAILMAGGVMISIAIISVAVYFYTNLQGYASANQDVLSSTQIQSFNRFYTAYKNSSTKIRVVDAVNILNRALEDEVSVVNSHTSIKSVPGAGGIVAYTIDDDHLETYLNEDVKYEISYDPEGKVSSVTISHS